MKEPFYKQCVCNKVIGGKRTLWQARLIEDKVKMSTVCGAGNTADNAIKDLAEQVRRRAKRLHNPIE